MEEKQCRNLSKIFLTQCLFSKYENQHHRLSPIEAALPQTLSTGDLMINRLPTDPSSSGASIYWRGMWLVCLQRSPHLLRGGNFLSGAILGGKMSPGESRYNLALRWPSLGRQGGEEAHVR